MQPQYITEAFTRFFWDKVNDSAGADACWPWLGKRYAAGYGIHLDTRTYL